MINQGQVLGRVGKIESKNTATGMKICNVSIVTSKKVLKNGVKVEKVTWHNVTLFNKLAEIAEKYVAVGDLLYVQGEMDNQKFTGQDGLERTKSYIIAHQLQLMPKSKEHKPEPNGNASYDNMGLGEDDVPF